MEKNKIRKLLFIGQLPPPIHGANIMNSYIVNSEIIKNSFSIDIVSLDFSKSLVEIRKFSLGKVWKALIYSFNIIRKVIISKPDLVYFTLSTTGYAFYRDSYYVLLLKMLNNKIVFHLHGKGIKQNTQNNILKKYLYNWVFKNVNVICLSELLIDDVSSVCKSKPYIVPNGIQTYPKTINYKFQRDNAVTQILYLSNYIESKGILVLIDAIENLRNLGYVFNATFVGAPSDLSIKFLEKVISDKDLGQFVKIIGPLYSLDKVKEFEKADIFIFPSYYKNEAFPLVLLEAMQFGIPIISTYEGGIPDIVIESETGFLVESQNDQMLTNKIAVLLENKEMRIEMGKRGYERFINNFTLNHFETKINFVFNDILNSQRKRNIIITSPSLDTKINVSGISSVTNFIIDNNPEHNYVHFKLGRGDHEKQNLLVLLKFVKAYSIWLFLFIFKKNIFIHFNLPLDKRSIIRDFPLILIARFLRKRMLIHLHGGEYLMKENFSNWIESIIKIILTGKETIITLSQLEKDIIIKKYSATNVAVLANCPDLKEAQKYNRIYSHQNTLSLLFIGRIVERKGLHVIFYALKLLKEKGINFKFYMAGTGHDEGKYVNKFHELLGKSFEFKGVVTGEKKSELMSSCDIFLLPSLSGEGLPMSLLESMSYGLVPIVTNDGSMSDVIKSGENGIIVKKGSASSLEDAILSLIKDEMFMEKVAKNARNYVFENHDPVEYIKQLNTLYRKDYY